MDIMLKRIFELIGDKRGARKSLGEAIGINPNRISDWESGRLTNYHKYAAKIAEYYGVSLDWLSGLTDERITTEKPVTIDDELEDLRFIRFPIIGTISAGNGCVAREELTGDYAYFSETDLHAPASEYFVLRIKGDSMYPQMLDGDSVLVRRKSSVDSGKIAVIIFNGEEATVKRVRYVQGENWVELIPTNPEYKTRRIEGADLELCRILGEVVRLTRNIG